MAYGITEALNKMNEMGVFSYVFPFMIVFAIVFGLLQKTKIFGDEEKAKGINAIIAVGIGFLSLLNDTVPTFFANIFPKFGVGLSIFLVLIILIGFFVLGDNGEGKNNLRWIGWVLGIGIVIWAFDEWGYYFWGGTGFGWWLEEYLPALIVLGLIVWGIIAVVGGGKGSNSKPRG